jgi:hypothetical protein
MSAIQRQLSVQKQQNKYEENIKIRLNGALKKGLTTYIMQYNVKNMGN